MSDRSNPHLAKDTTPPDRGGIQREPNVGPDERPRPPLVEAASRTGRHPTHDPAPRAQRARRSNR